MRTPSFCPPLRKGGGVEGEILLLPLSLLSSPGTHPWGPRFPCSGNQGGGGGQTETWSQRWGVTKMGFPERHWVAERRAASPPGFSGCLHPFLGLGQATQAAKASSLRGHRKFGMRNGAMVGAGGWDEEEVGW